MRLPREAPAGVARDLVWTPLHEAARSGDLAAVRELLAAGADPNAREEGDNTYADALGGRRRAPRRSSRALADAGGDVIGAGDDHQLEVIGWATCWDTAHTDVADLLVSRGARHTHLLARSRSASPTRSPATTSTPG